MGFDPDRTGTDSLSEMRAILGNETRISDDGRAVAAAGEFRLDVIRLDISPHKMNRYKACLRIRQAAGGPNIVVIAQTDCGPARPGSITTGEH